MTRAKCTASMAKCLGFVGNYIKWCNSASENPRKQNQNILLKHFQVCLQDQWEGGEQEKSLQASIGSHAPRVISGQVCAPRSVTVTSRFSSPEPTHFPLIRVALPIGDSCCKYSQFFCPQIPSTTLPSSPVKMMGTPFLAPSWLLDLGPHALGLLYLNLFLSVRSFQPL